MNNKMSYCGYLCESCPAFEKNLMNEAQKSEISNAWKKYFGFDVPIDEIKPCAGCKNEGFHADPDCRVRPCASERAVINCAYCPEFGCDLLMEKIDFIGNTIKDIKSIPEQDFKKYIEPFLSEKRLHQIRDKIKSNF